MPIFDDSSLDVHAIAGSSYTFSATRIERLGAAEYTLVVIAADVSGSVCAFRSQIEACVKAVVRSCRHSPRADNLMLRFVVFDQSVDEVHGFLPLAECHESRYDGAIRAGGTTALFDAAHDGASSLARYGEDLARAHLGVNAILFAITDGEDNASRLAATDVRRAMAQAVQSEAIESVLSVLVGVGCEPAGGLGAYLQAFHDDVGFSQFVALEQADEDTLARLSHFVSRSIAAQSRALGSGAASRLLTF